MAEKTRPAVLDVGQCDPDHGALRGLLRDHFDVEIERVMFVPEALAAMRRKRYALVLVNRLVFADQSDGMELIRAARAEPALAGTPIMLISNFADAQQRAIAAGAVEGFGKARLNAPATIERLAAYLPARSVPASR